jgi:hypothetical protein
VGIGKKSANKKRSYSWFCNSMLNALVVLPQGVGGKALSRKKCSPVFLSRAIHGEWPHHYSINRFYIAQNGG